MKKIANEDETDNSNVNFIKLILRPSMPFIQFLNDSRDLLKFCPQFIGGSRPKVWELLVHIDLQK